MINDSGSCVFFNDLAEATADKIKELDKTCEEGRTTN